jgi:hypothetical protein
MEARAVENGAPSREQDAAGGLMAVNGSKPFPVGWNSERDVQQMAVYERFALEPAVGLEPTTC